MYLLVQGRQSVDGCTPGGRTAYPLQRLCRTLPAPPAAGLFGYRGSLFTESAMVFLIVDFSEVSRGGVKARVQVTPNSLLSEVLRQAWEQVQTRCGSAVGDAAEPRLASLPANWGLRHGKRWLDLSLPFRLSGLSAQARIVVDERSVSETAKTSVTGKPGQTADLAQGVTPAHSLTVAVQYESDPPERYIAPAVLEDTLWSVLERANPERLWWCRPYLLVARYLETAHYGVSHFRSLRLRDLGLSPGTRLLIRIQCLTTDDDSVGWEEVEASAGAARSPVASNRHDHADATGGSDIASVDKVSSGQAATRESQATADLHLQHVEQQSTHLVLGNPGAKSAFVDAPARVLDTVSRTIEEPAASSPQGERVPVTGSSDPSTANGDRQRDTRADASTSPRTPSPSSRGARPSTYALVEMHEVDTSVPKVDGVVAEPADARNSASSVNTESGTTQIPIQGAESTSELLIPGRTASDAPVLETNGNAGAPAGQVPERYVRFYLPTTIRFDAQLLDLPDTFYDLTPEELRRILHAQQRQQEEATVLRTRRHTTASRAGATQPEQCVVRVRLPDQTVIEGRFWCNESLDDLYAFVRRFVTSTNGALDAFKLYQTPPKRVLHAGPTTLHQVQLCPASVLVLVPSTSNTYGTLGLRPEFRSRLEKSPLEAAFAKEVAQAEALRREYAGVISSPHTTPPEAAAATADGTAANAGKQIRSEDAGTGDREPDAFSKADRARNDAEQQLKQRLPKWWRRPPGGRS